MKLWFQTVELSGDTVCSILPFSYMTYFTSHIRFHTRRRKQGGCWPRWFPAAEVQQSCLYYLHRCHKIVRGSDYEGKKREAADQFKTVLFIKYRIYASILSDLSSFSSIFLVGEGWTVIWWIKNHYEQQWFCVFQAFCNWWDTIRSKNWQAEI